jgi:Trk K+ transport system NAD-binding subunit
MLVNRGTGAFIPRGDQVIEPGDRIVVITKNGSEAEIGRFFGAKFGYPQ